MAPYPFGLHDKDKEGRPLDKTNFKIAEEIGPDFARYRQEKVDGESTSNALQSPAEAASQAGRNSKTESSLGYLTPVYKRIVNKFLARKKGLVPVNDSFLEDLANFEKRQSCEDTIHKRLLVEKILTAMDPDTQRICQWRLQGYSMREIAEELKITPNCLSVRYTRGLKKAATEVLDQKRD
jgi:RNA polymerase sigma factor (sigma-70 family)